MVLRSTPGFLGKSRAIRIIPVQNHRMDLVDPRQRPPGGSDTLVGIAHQPCGVILDAIHGNRTQSRLTPSHKVLFEGSWQRAFDFTTCDNVCNAELIEGVSVGAICHFG